MPQESYADFSIIQKYLDQKRYYDESVKEHQAMVAKLEGSISALKGELQAKDQALKQLLEQAEVYEATIKEREKSMQELTLTVHRLKKQIDGGLPGTGFQNGEEQKAKFGFIKK
jgi:chromosome segregation ATPase